MFFIQIVEDMDTLEETPIADISATYLTDEQFNSLYPKHPIDVSNYLLMFTFRQCIPSISIPRIGIPSIGIPSICIPSIGIPSICIPSL